METTAGATTLATAASARPPDASLRYRATHDPLTGLANRDVLLDRIDGALADVASGGPPFAVLFCDLDRFKLVNDTLGHDAGDEVLRVVGDRLRSVCDGDATVARLGGDEFAIVATEAADDDLDRLVTRVLGTARAAVPVHGRMLPMSMSIGVAVVDSRHHEATDLLRDADAALYDAKAAGRDRVQRFSREHAERLQRRAEIERDLRELTARGEVVLHYQPIVDLRDGTVVGVEALMRWERADGPVDPTTFIAIAEETGLIALLDRLALFAACRQLGAWQRAYGAAAPRMVTVNMSGRDFGDPGMVDVVRAAIQQGGITPQSLCIDLSEQSMIASTGTTIAGLESLRELGCYLAIDDFGTGYSSLAAVRSLPVEVLKIDRTFVAGVDCDPQDGAVVAAVMSLAHALGLHVVAEGVEREAQRRALLDLGCTTGQGYLFAPAEPSDAVAATWSAEAVRARRAAMAHGRRIVRKAGASLFIDEFMHQMGIPRGGRGAARDRRR